MSTSLPITADDRLAIYTASEAQTEFAIGFPFQFAADLAVYKRIDGVLGNRLSIGDDYFAVGENEPTGGTLTLTAECAEGDEVIIVGATVLERTQDVTLGGKFSSRQTDKDFDRNVLIAQELSRDLARTMRVAFGETGGALEVGAANVLPVWDANGNLVAGPVWGDTLGTPGPGVAAGGTIGQILVKASSADYDTAWASSIPASAVAFTPAGDLVATTVQAALEELDTEKANSADLGTAAGADTGDFATAAQGGLADSAVQPGDLGTAAGADTGDFATAAQGGLADSAVQPGDSDASALGWVVDEDDMSSDSATKVPTQQSVKAYVDAHGGGLTLVSNQQPTSDVSAISVTGLAGYGFVKVMCIVALDNSGNSLSLQARTSAGTWRTICSTGNTAGSDDMVMISCEIAGFNLAQEKVCSFIVGTDTSDLDSSDESNEVSSNMVAGGNIMTWNEIWDEVRVTTGDAILGATADERGRMHVYAG